jgi:tetratricopeptide (TPR) repeat protein
MFHIGKYGNAIDCFTLSIQYASVHYVTLGMLYSNRSHAYFKKKQFKKAKEDAEKCVKYRPNWSEVWQNNFPPRCLLFVNNTNWEGVVVVQS